MKIFKTDRLIIRNLAEFDSDYYYDMMGNPNVMSLIPRKVMSREESNKHLNSFVGKDQTQTDTKVWGIESKNENEFIGLCAFLKNDENEDENERDGASSDKVKVKSEKDDNENEVAHEIEAEKSN